MKDRPGGVEDSELRRALRAWQIDAASLVYAPVGFGDYHWSATDTGGQRWFVTVANLAHKPQSEDRRKAALRGLRRAMDTASVLATAGRLDFVVAPLRTVEGDTVRRLGAEHAISVFPFVDGAPGCFDQVLTGPERGLVVDMLAALHSATPPAVTPVARPELATRVRLEEALGELGRRWRGGPFAEPARALMSDHAWGLRRWLAEFDRRVAELGRSGPQPVVTHGEPHPGNLVWSPGRHLLVDWDTVGLAVPERDLWWVATEVDLAGTNRPAAGCRTGRPWRCTGCGGLWTTWPSTSDSFRSPHSRTPDTELAWASLAGTVAQLTG